MPTSAEDLPIRILHLSDIHFRASKAWDADPVLRALAGFIRGEVEEGLTPDLVVISGDVAFAGKAEEYAMAKGWLEDHLWPALATDLPRDRLLLVPGNHDVDRSKVGTGVRSMQNGLLEAGSQEDIASLLGDDDERGMMLRRHAAYTDFVREWRGEPDTLPWWQRVIEIRGTHLHVAGLDTAWMSCDDEDRSRLLLGHYQLTQTVETTQAEGADWRIAILHHPWAYLAEFDDHKARSTVHQHCDLLLRGHLHHPLSERVVPPARSRACLELAAGCVYDGSDYPNGYQWIELAPAEKSVRVLFRTWQHNAWTIDRNQPDCPEGHADFDLGTPSSVPDRRRSAAPKIPSEYLEWLRKRCASVELLGQDIQKSHAFTLSHVYVPALYADMSMAQGAARVRVPLVPLLQLVDQHSLYISAPAGAGKSTFCRWAALQSIPDASASHSHPIPAPEEYQEPVPTALRTCLPVLVPLRDFAKDMDCGRGPLTWHRGDLEQALVHWIDRSPPPGLSGALLKDHLAAGAAFLLLDGVDEVAVSEDREGTTVYPRALLLSGLADALPAWEAAGNRTLLTGRPYGLDEAGLARLGLPRAPLEPLPKPLQHLFVTRWFHTLRKEELAANLLEAMRGRDDLAPLIENPMLLTAVCVLYDKGGRLPEDRYELYKSIVDGVLHSRYPGNAREREPVLRRLEAIAYGMHAGEPELETRQTPAAEISWVDTERLLARFAEDNPAYGRGEVDAAVRREELLTRSGLLLPRPNDRAAFYHLSFQEFLVAQRIARGSDKRAAEVIHAREAVPEWRPTLLFLFAAQILNKDPEWGLDLLARWIESQDRGAVLANPATAVLAAEALELCLAKGYQIPEPLAEGFRQLSLQAIEDEIEIPARQALGLVLGRLGDPRVAGLRDPKAYVEVPAGTYPFGDEEQTEIASPFKIGRYPVTNSQYRDFVEDDGYHNRDWWSDAGWRWLQGQGVAEPGHWRDARWNGPNQPVVAARFWEAEACCAWAGGRLPREEEWEAAARGPDGCAYPWCGEWQDGICNTREAGLGVTSPVGLFPASRQAGLGVDDMAGNVWEWCASIYGDDPTGGQGATEDSRPRVLRGGSWHDNLDYARCANRDRDSPSFRSSGFGFRVVCSSPINEP